MRGNLEVGEKMARNYEMVVGLEVHAELKTEDKNFLRRAPLAFGAEPNTQCCPVCMGMPGTSAGAERQGRGLCPRKPGLLRTATIARPSKAGPQKLLLSRPAEGIIRFRSTTCRSASTGTSISRTAEGEKRVGITQHPHRGGRGQARSPRTEDGTHGRLQPLRRARLSRSCRSPTSARPRRPSHTCAKLRAMPAVIYGVSDCRMNEGSLRCDVNLSVRRRGDRGARHTHGDEEHSTPSQFIAKAIAYEFARQVGVLEEGEPVVQETRRFDAASRAKTFSMRVKGGCERLPLLPRPGPAVY